jgi:hypothetical protein
MLRSDNKIMQFAVHVAPQQELRYQFEPGRTYRTHLNVRTESRARSGEGSGDSSSEHDMILRTEVLRAQGSGYVVQTQVENEAGTEHLLLVDGQGHVAPLDGSDLFPGAWLPLPATPISVGARWSGAARPYGFSAEVAIHYTLQRLQNGRALLAWTSPAVTTPDGSGGRREHRAFGSFWLDLGNGRLVEGRSVTRTRHLGPGWEVEAICQLDLRDLT